MRSVLDAMSCETRSAWSSSSRFKSLFQSARGREVSEGALLSRLRALLAGFWQAKPWRIAMHSSKSSSEIIASTEGAFFFFGALRKEPEDEGDSRE